MLQQRIVIANPESVALSVIKSGQVVRGLGLEFKLIPQLPSPRGFKWVEAERGLPEGAGRTFLVKGSDPRPVAKRGAGRPTARRQSEAWALHREFASLPTTEGAILEFASTYGWLGVDHTHLYYAGESGSLVSVHGESLDLWKHHILKMRAILSIIGKWRAHPGGTWFRDYQAPESTNNGDGASPRVVSPGVWVSVPYTLPKQVESAADAYLAVQEELHFELARGVRLRLDTSISDLPTMHLCSQSLLANIYIAVAKELTQQSTTYTQCICGAWFIPKRSNVLQCSPTCRVNKSRAKRRERERREQV